MITDYRTLQYPYRGYRIVSRWDPGSRDGGRAFPPGWYSDVFRGDWLCEISFRHAVRAHTIVRAEEWVDAALAKAAEKLVESL